MLYYDEETRRRYVILAIFFIVFSPLAIALLSRGFSVSNQKNDTDNTQIITIDTENRSEDSKSPILYKVISVADGDTINIDYEGQSTAVRFIGVNTPETVDPRTTVECFGVEASDYLKNLLTGKEVAIESDSSQSNLDKFGRLLRYVYIDGKDVGLEIISNGYGYEYTYDFPYQKQSEYKAAQQSASNTGKGLWAAGVCESPKEDDDAQTYVSQTTDCTIKGNISSKGEKIYHVPGQQYYDVTKISPEKGERYFCSESEAIAAGWRKSKV